MAEAFDFGAEVGLGVEPGPGDSGVFGDGVEGDRSAFRVQRAQRLDGFGPGESGALLCSFAAEARGQTRLIEMNQAVLHNLDRIIDSLDDTAPAEAAG